MTKRVINEVQEYLTICGENRVYQIVNVEMLLKKHPGDAVIGFLNLLRNDYKKELKQLIQNNKTDARINELVAKNFRIRMAINTIRNSKIFQRDKDSHRRSDLHGNLLQCLEFQNSHNNQENKLNKFVIQRKHAQSILKRIL